MHQQLESLLRTPGIDNGPGEAMQAHAFPLRRTGLIDQGAYILVAELQHRLESPLNRPQFGIGNLMIGPSHLDEQHRRRQFNGGLRAILCGGRLNALQQTSQHHAALAACDSGPRSASPLTPSWSMASSTTSSRLLRKALGQESRCR